MPRAAKYDGNRPNTGSFDDTIAEFPEFTASVVDIGQLQPRLERLYVSNSFMVAEDLVLWVPALHVMGERSVSGAWNAMLTKGIQIAAAFERVAELEGGQGLSSSQILKLLYYGQALSLAEHGVPLFDGKFEAWTHGPVEPTVWKFIRENESRRVDWREQLTSTHVQLPDETWELVRDVFSVFGGLTPIQLSKASHAERPWLEARDGKRWDEQSAEVIDEHSIRDFYAEVIDDGNDVMQELSITPEPDAPAWALPYRIGVNVKRLVGHPFFGDSVSRDLRRRVGLAEFPGDWSGFDFSPLALTAQELASPQAR